MKEPDADDDDLCEEGGDPADSVDEAPESDAGGGPRRALTESDRPPPAVALPTAEERRAWFNAAYEESEGFVRGMLDRPDIEPDSAADAHQNVFATLDAVARGTGFPGNLDAMLVTITGNEMRNHGRRRRRRPELDDDVSVEDVPGHETDAEQWVYAAERRRILERILARMTEKDAELIRLIDLAEMSCKEAAEALGRKAETPTRQHARASVRFKAIGRELFGRGPGRDE